MKITDEMVEAALHGADYVPNPANREWMRAALTAALAAPAPIQGWDLVKGLENGSVVLDADMKPRRAALAAAVQEGEKEQNADAIIAWYGTNGTEWRRKDHKSPVGMKPREYVPAPAAAVQEAKRICTCHPDDNPPVPCAEKYALSACKASVHPAPADAGVVGSQETVTIPKEPTDELLRSMAIRYDHGLGIPGYYDQEIFGAGNVSHERRMESAIRTMRQLHEEVVGTGFYRSALPTKGGE